MKKDLDFSRPSGSEKTNEPKVIGEVLSEYFRSNEPLARAYRNRLFKNLFPDTHLGIDLKVLSREPKRMSIGDMKAGMLIRDSEDRFTLIPNGVMNAQAKTVRRNPIVFEGGTVNVHRLADSSYRLEFVRPRFYPDFTFRDFCLAASQELQTIARLLGDEASEK